MLATTSRLIKILVRTSNLGKDITPGLTFVAGISATTLHCNRYTGNNVTI